MTAPRSHRSPRHAFHGWRGVSSLGLVRLVLFGFMLSLGVAIASPIVHAQALELVCSGAGAGKLIVHGGDGDHEIGASHVDCPMCLPGGAPPPLASAPALPTLVPADVPRDGAAAPLFAAMALAPPARGPPILL